MSGIGVAAEGGTDSGYAIGGHRRPYSPAADDDAALGVMAQHRERDLLGVVFMDLPLHWRGGIEDLVTGSRQFGGNPLLGFMARRIGSDCDLHYLSSSQSSRRPAPRTQPTYCNSRKMTGWFHPWPPVFRTYVPLFCNPRLLWKLR